MSLYDEVCAHYYLPLASALTLKSEVSTDRTFVSGEEPIFPVVGTTRVAAERSTKEPKVH
jgi:hypothetical protein